MPKIVTDTGGVMPMPNLRRRRANRSRDRKSHALRVAVCALPLIATPIYASDVSWILNRTGSWSADANWVGGAPHAGDNGFVGSGVGTVDQVFSLGNFTFTGGVLQGGSSISTSGTFTWNGAARLGGAGTLTSNGTMLINGSAEIDGRIINNAGSAIWSAGDLQPYQLSVPDVFNNLAGATFDIQGDHNISAFNAGATLSFNNAGVIRKDTTLGTTQFINATLTNSGTVDVQTGTLAIGAGSSGGNFNVASGATISFNAYSFNPGTSFTGAGVVMLNGTGSFNADVLLGSLQLASTFSAIDGTGRLMVAHELDHKRGDQLGSGTIQIESGATMNVMSPANASHQLFRNIDNLGTINWSGTASIETGRGAVINNNGTWNFTTDQSLNRPTTGNLPAMTINNTGTLSKSAGSGSTLIEATLTNTGTIAVTSGVLNLGLGGTSEGGSTIAIGASGTLRFGGPAFWIKSGTTLTDSGTLDCSLGSLRADASLLSAAHVQMNGFELGIDGTLDDDQFTWNRGELSGPGVTKLMNDRTFSVAWGIGAGRTLDTNGHNLTWDGDSFGSGLGASVFGYAGAGTIENRAGSTFAVSLASGQYDIANGDDVVIIHNSGTFVLNSDSTLRVSGAFNNDGTVQLNAGTLVLLGGGNHTGTFNGSGTLVLAGGSHDFGSTSTIDPIFFQVQSGSATLNNPASDAYTMQAVIVGDPSDDSHTATLTILANVNVAASDVTIIAGSNLTIDGGAIAASDSVTLDQGTQSTSEDGGITLTNNASVSSPYVSVRHATLDLESGTISATGSFEITGGSVNFGASGHVTTPDLELTGGTVNVYPGFAWPAPNFSTNGSTIDLKPGANLAFPTASTISEGGLLIESGATLSVDSMSHAGASEVQGALNISHDLVMVNSSPITVDQHGSISAASISGDGSIALNGGTITTTSAPGLSFSNASYLSGVGTINGNVTNDGVFIVGNPSGTISINGDLTLQADSQFATEIDGTPSALQSPELFVSGAAHLNGTFYFILLNDAVLLPNQSLELMRWSTHDGTFGTFNYASPYAGLSYQLTYATDRLLVNGVALPGDVNLDGVVNALDFNAIATDFGMSGDANWLQGDLSGDGVVNSQDFMLLATHFGDTLPTPIGAIVPEPSLAIPVLTMLCAFLGRKRATK